MKIVNSFPPNIEAIRQRFDIQGRNIVFAYGDILYVPSGNTNIPEHLMVHEETHEKQQSVMGVEEWWNKYLVDDQFRLSQEVEAYQNQWQYLKYNVNRHERRRIFSMIVKDLSGPIYGNLVSREEAERLITADGEI